MATLKSIAQEAGVSPMVVSAVVRNDFSRIRVSAAKRAEIQKLVAAHHYVPNATAQSLVSRRTHIVTLFVPSMSFFEVPFQHQLLSGLQNRLKGADYRLAFCAFNEDELPANMPADAGLFFYYGEPNLQPLQRVLHMPFPVVVFGHCPHPGIHCLYRDNFGAMSALGETLLGQKHKRVLLVESFRGHVFNQDGTDGFLQAVAQSGDVELKRTVATPAHPTPHRTDLLLAAGRKVAQAILNDAFRPTLAVFANDTIALGALLALQQAGVRVPEELALAANGSDPYTDFFCPTLTKVTCDPYAAGERCGDLLLARLNGTSIPEEQTITLDLRLNASTGRP